MYTRASYLSCKVKYRFKRWCRKGYAAFASLGRTVTIGCLAAHVSERFQTKYTSLHRGGLQFAAGTGTSSPEEDEESAEQALATSRTAARSHSYLRDLWALRIALQATATDCACTFSLFFCFPVQKSGRHPGLPAGWSSAFFMGFFCFTPRFFATAIRLETIPFLKQTYFSNINQSVII